MKLIDKDIVIAEIERELKNINLNYVSVGSHPSDSDTNKKLQDGISKNLQILLSFINTLEVKEVDLEKEIDKFYGMYRKNGITFSIEDNQECLDWKEDCNPDFEIGFARHFFELGMRVSNKA